LLFIGNRRIVGGLPGGTNRPGSLALWLADVEKGEAKRIDVSTCMA